VIHIVENPPKTSGEFVAEPWVGRSTIHSYSSRGGYRGYQTFAEIFYCIILQTCEGVPTICVYPITIARLDTQCIPGQGGGCV
jgi:hypothetical protein